MLKEWLLIHLNSSKTEIFRVYPILKAFLQILSYELLRLHMAAEQYVYYYDVFVITCLMLQVQGGNTESFNFSLF